MNISIDKGIKIPVRMKGGRSSIYPFAKMKVGDSFFVPAKEGSEISGSIGYWTKKLHPAVFKSRLYDNNGVRENRGGIDGLRIFRVK